MKCTAHGVLFAAVLLLRSAAAYHTASSLAGKHPLLSARRHRSGSPAVLVASSPSPSLSLRMALSAYETVLEFNAQFKQGLKFVLVPQSAHRAAPGSYYDTGRIPDLEPPPELLAAVAATSNTDNDNYMKAATTTMPSFSLPDVQMAAPANTELSTDNPSLDALARDVDAVVQAARDVVSGTSGTTSFPSAGGSSFGLASIDPVAERTMAQLREALSHPPHWADYIPRGTPRQGLATPLLDYVTSALGAVREHQHLPLSAWTELPQDYVTVQYGFQVKGVALAAARELRADATQAAAAAHRAAVESFDRTAGVRQQLQTAVRERNAAVGDALHANNAAVATRLSANAAELAALIRRQFPQLDGAPRGLPTLPVEQLATVRRSLQEVLAASEWQLADVVSALRLDELGGWYAGLVVGCLLLALASERQSTLGRAAASAGGGGPRSFQTPKRVDRDMLEKQRLQGMIVELSQAVVILTSELRDLKAQRAATTAQLVSIQTDVSNVKVEVNRNTASEQQLCAILEESTASNAALQYQLESARYEVATLRNALSVLPEIDMPAIPPRPPVVPPPQLAGNQTLHAELSEVFFASVVDRADEAAAPRTRTPAMAGAGCGGGGVVDDWSNLSITALKRKPMTEIMAYLKAKGASITGVDGKPLKKSELLEAIFSF